MIALFAGFSMPNDEAVIEVARILGAARWAKPDTISFTAAARAALSVL